MGFISVVEGVVGHGSAILDRERIGIEKTD
jgi:hypothetical protein